MLVRPSAAPRFRRDRRRRRAALAVVLLTVGSTAASAASSGTKPAPVVTVGAPCVNSVRGATDEAGRPVQCYVTAAGRLWVWSSPIPSPLVDPPIPATWADVVPNTDGANADAPEPALPGIYVNRAAMEARLVAIFNGIRVSRGLRPLVVDPRLTRLARAWAEQTNEATPNGRVSKFCPSELCAVRAAEIGYPNFGEVIRPWNPYPKGDIADERFFLDSPRHLEILTNPKATHVGFGVHIVGEPSAPESIVVVGEVGRSR
jgi:Cysteine-rich secretory protein family